MPSPIRQQRTQPLNGFPVPGSGALVNASCADQASGRLLDARDLPLHLRPFHRTADRANVLYEWKTDASGRLYLDYIRYCDVHGVALGGFTSADDAAGCECPGCAYDDALRLRGWRPGFALVLERGIVDDRR